MSAETAVASLHLVGLDQLKRRWGWFLALGLLLVILGTAAIGASTMATLATMVFVGWLMIAGGAMQAVHAFSCKAWGGFFIDLLSGILYAVVGSMLVVNPAKLALGLTLLIAVFLIFGGLFRIVVAVTSQFHHRMWLLLSGVVNVLLGILIWNELPDSGLWVIGLFVGIDMIFNGWSLIMLSLAAKNLPDHRAAA